MTITARHVTRRLDKINPTIVDIWDRLPHVAPAILADVDRRNDNRQRTAPAAAPDADAIRAVGGISDPTADTALANMAQHGRQLDALAADLGAFVQAALRLVEHCDRWVVSAANAEPHPRCSGGGTVADWCDPTCSELVMSSKRADGSHSYNRDGLCAACYKRRQRFNRAMERGAA